MGQGGGRGEGGQTMLVVRLFVCKKNWLDRADSSVMGVSMLHLQLRMETQRCAIGLQPNDDVFHPLLFLRMPVLDSRRN